jgi:hypothetical protein
MKNGGTQHNDTQHNNKNETLSITLVITAFELS